LVIIVKNNIEMAGTFNHTELILLQVFEVINLLISVIFMGLFAYRYHKLKSFSMTEQFIRTSILR
jgi:hypothetical protein